MATLAVKGLNRPLHLRSKSSSRPQRSNDSQSERDLKAKRVTTKPNQDTKDDAATASFVRRVLCSGHVQPGTENSPSLEGVLPPLTSSNEIDLQLYAIIAVIIKDFVQTWYTRITPDHEFVDEVIQIIAHCTRGLEQRLRRVDLESLLLDEIPRLLNQHTEATRFARSSTQSATSQSLGADARTVYHSVHPHPALSPVPTESDPETIVAQRSNEMIWRQLLVEGLLNNLLPPEDLQNPCLKVLVNEIFAELIVGNVLCNKVSEGWFIWDVTAKAIQASRPSGTSVPDSPKPKKSARLDQFGLLPDAASTRKPDRAKQQRIRSIYAIIINIGWEALRIVWLVYVSMRGLVLAFSNAIYLPPRSSDTKSRLQGSSGIASSPSTSFTASAEAECSADVVQDSALKQDRIAVLDMSVWQVPVHILGLDLSMPWLIGVVSLVKHYILQGPGRVGSLDARLDRLLSHHITTLLFSPSALPGLLRTVRANMFPNNAMAPGKPPPATDEDIRAIKRTCAEEILSLIPERVGGVYFGRCEAAETVGEQQQEQEKRRQREFEVGQVETSVLNLFSDGYLNKHFLFAVVEVVVCRLFPEMAGNGED